MSACSLDATIAAISIVDHSVNFYDFSTGVAVLAGTVAVKALRIKNLSNIPQEITIRDCPVLFPNPINWLGAGVTTPGNFDNKIAGRQRHEYSLNYILAYTEDGADRAIKDSYIGMAALVQELTSKLMKIDMTATSITRVSTSVFGQITDPVGKGFIGCGIVITAVELIP